MSIEMVWMVAVLASVVMLVVVVLLQKVVDWCLRRSDRRHHLSVVRWSKNETKARMRERAHVGWAEQFGYPEGLIPYHRQLALASWTRPPSHSCARAQARLLETAILLHLIVEEGGRDEAAPTFANELEDVLFQ